MMTMGRDLAANDDRTAKHLPIRLQGSPVPPPETPTPGEHGSCLSPDTHGKSKL
jgi:hypothetical protein